MKKKYNEWLFNWLGFSTAFAILAIISKYVSIPWIYAKPVMDSVVLAFGISSIIFGIIFMVHRIKYLKELDKKYKI